VRRGGKGLIYAPHITAPPHRILDYAKVRHRCAPTDHVQRILHRRSGPGRPGDDEGDAEPAGEFYGHNGGITDARAAHLREVLDLFARLDGIDFRQTLR